MKLYNSAYPGSMFEKQDGSYIEASDTSSMLESLAEHLKAKDRQIEDLEALVIQLRAELSGQPA